MALSSTLLCEMVVSYADLESVSPFGDAIFHTS